MFTPKICKFKSKIDFCKFIQNTHIIYRIFCYSLFIFAVTPERPTIRNGSTKEVITKIQEPYNEGSNVNLICEVHGGKPPPKVTWFLENTVIDESYQYRDDEDVTSNHLSYPAVGRQHLQARLICQASNTNLVQAQSRVLVLDLNRKFQNYLPLHFQQFQSSTLHFNRQLAKTTRV